MTPTRSQVLEAVQDALEREGWSISAAIVSGKVFTSHDMSARRAQAALLALEGLLGPLKIEAPAALSAPNPMADDLPVHEMEITVRSADILERNGLKTAGDLRRAGVGGMLRLPDVGRVTCAQVMCALEGMPLQDFTQRQAEKFLGRLRRTQSVPKALASDGVGRAPRPPVIDGEGSRDDQNPPQSTEKARAVDGLADPQGTGEGR